MADDALRSALLELVSAASSAGIHVLLGGGYGLYLKQVHLITSQQRTFLPVDAWPRPRSTQDLDIFLPSEILIDVQHMVRLREILDQLAYQPVVKFLHFQKQVAQGLVRVELLAGPVGPHQGDKVQIKGSRVRPKGKVELHAYLAQEAITLEVDPLSIPLGSGVSVLIPNAFSLLLMKLHACHDRLDDEDKDLGRHHALDIYRILAMLSEPEDDLVRRLRQDHRGNAAVKGAMEIAAEIFANVTSRGVLRMREHALATEAMQVERVLELLHDLLKET